MSKHIDGQKTVVADDWNGANDGDGLERRVARSLIGQLDLVLEARGVAWQGVVANTSEVDRRVDAVIYHGQGFAHATSRVERIKHVFGLTVAVAGVGAAVFGGLAAGGEVLAGADVVEGTEVVDVTTGTGGAEAVGGDVGWYRIIDGVHRAKAALQLGLETIDAEIIEGEKVINRTRIPVRGLRVRPEKSVLVLDGKGLYRWMRALEEMGSGKSGPIKVEIRTGGTPIEQVKLLKPRDL